MISPRSPSPSTRLLTIRTTVRLRLIRRCTSTVMVTVWPLARRPAATATRRSGLFPFRVLPVSASSEPSLSLIRELLPSLRVVGSGMVLDTSSICPAEAVSLMTTPRCRSAPVRPSPLWQPRLRLRRLVTARCATSALDRARRGLMRSAPPTSCATSSRLTLTPTRSSRRGPSLKALS